MLDRRETGGLWDSGGGSVGGMTGGEMTGRSV